MIRFLLILACIGATHAADVLSLPSWAIPGILAVETRSYVGPSGGIIYVDRRVGDAGELGCCQILRSAFNIVRRPRERFETCADNSIFCVQIATRYLRWIYEHKAGHDWLRAIGMYNAGFSTSRRSMNRRISYLNKVRNAGTR